MSRKTSPDSAFNTGMTLGGKPMRHNVPSSPSSPAWKPSKGFIVPEDIIFYAFRYALGRASYAVTDTCSEIRAHAVNMTAKTRNLIIKEIKWELSNRELITDPFPHQAEWERTLKVLEGKKAEEVE